MNCREIREMSLWWWSVWSQGVYSPAIYCTKRTGRLLASTCGCAGELRSVCLDCGFPSVRSCKYMRHTGSWPRSSPGSGFCGLTEFAIFIVWAVQHVCGKGRDQAYLLAAAVSFLFCFSFQLYLCFKLCVHLINHFSVLLKYFLHRIYHPL